VVGSCEHGNGFHKRRGFSPLTDHTISFSIITLMPGVCIKRSPSLQRTSELQVSDILRKLNLYRVFI
jgi:hypothetical protein